MTASETSAWMLWSLFFLGVGSMSVVAACTIMVLTPANTRAIRRTVSTFMLGGLALMLLSVVVVLVTSIKM